MPTVAIINLKGGVGKTVSAIGLASAAALAGEEVRVIDTDSQGSATLWYVSAEESGNPLPFSVDPANQITIKRVKSGTDWVFIDCPPSGSVADEAAAIADFVVVPTSAAPLDIQQTWSTIQTLEAAGKPYAVLIVRAAPRTLAHRAAVDALEEANVSYFETTIPQREDIKNNFGSPFENNLFGYSEVFSELKEAI